MVAAAQFLSVYLFYNALFLIVSPTFTIAWVSCIASFILVATVCTAMLLEVVGSCCKTCLLGRIIKGLAFLLLGLLCFAINYYAVKQLRDTEQHYSNARGLLSSLVSSVVTGLYGYVVKKMLFQWKEDVGREETKTLEWAPLIQKDENIQ